MTLRTSTHSSSTKPRPGSCRISPPPSSCTFASLIRDVEISSKCHLGEAADANEEQQAVRNICLSSLWFDVRTKVKIVTFSHSFDFGRGGQPLYDVLLLLPVALYM
ncbi:hypothetical protein PAXINDRAFT_19364 [Paxillus involutus ATCC 200175]|uniref:Uncharacterized protein n=1 Tax=Paxillus involutus ATCC 200175 TaxID=664439 RepID=A0A0C9SN77_PAXIN|nr:hypothetical protein PAXINDRAFT_19364 [Paxillus involutus ATCC 200175]